MYFKFFCKRLRVEGKSLLIRRLGGSLPALAASLSIYEPRCEKTGLRGFRPGPTQTRLYSHRI